MRNDFEWHEQCALLELEDHILNCKYGGGDRDQEIRIREDDFYDNFQIKMVGDLVKIKWEAPCSWVNCHWHLYYCRMSPVEWKTPFELAEK